MKVKGKLKCGYKFNVDDRIANDFEIAWLLRKATKEENDEFLYQALEKIFGGDDEIDKLVECLKDKDGFVDNANVGGVFEEIYLALGEAGKNS